MVINTLNLLLVKLSIGKNSIISLIFIMLFLFQILPTNIVNASENDSPISLNIELIEKVLSHTDKTKQIYMAEFTTVPNPATKIAYRGRQRRVLEIEGTFRLIDELNLKAPKLGARVSKSVTFRNPWHLRVNVITYENLKHLLPKSRYQNPDSSAPQQHGKYPPITVLVIADEKSVNPLDCDFMYAIPKDEVKRLSEFIKSLLKNDIDKISRAKAEELLKSADSYQVYQGIARLREIEGIKHFFVLLHNLPEEYYAQIVSELCKQSKRSEKDITTEEMISFLRKAPPDKQIVFLKELKGQINIVGATIWEERSAIRNNKIDNAMLKSELKELIKERADKEEWIEAKKLYQEILEELW